MFNTFYSTTADGPVITETINVIPDQTYFVKIAIAGIDLSSSGEYVSSITMNGENFGSCGGNCDTCCSTWFDCSNDVYGLGRVLTKNTVKSSNGRIDIQLTYTSTVGCCRCNWQNIQVQALANITLIPMQGESNKSP